MLRSRVWVAALALAALAGTARAQQDVATKIAQLNKRAMEDYDLLEFEAARKSLLEAASLIKKHGLESDPNSAKTYINLGIVYVGGLKDRYKGFQQFVKALQIKPDAKIDPALATPELQEVFDNARDTVGVPRAGKSTAKTPPAPPPVEPEQKVTPSPATDGTAEEVHGLQHKAIDEVPAGQPVAVRAQVGSDVQAARLFLFYRTPDREDFATLPMTKNKKGQYVATIPAEATNGKSLQYYIEARDARGKPLIGNGSATSPNIITVSSAAGSQAPEPDENPLLQRQTRDTGIEKKAEAGKPTRSNVWISVGAGTGFGLATGHADLQSSVNIETGVAPAYVHLLPEIGFFVSERVALSAQARIQVLTNADSGSQSPNCMTTQTYYCGSPASGGAVVLGRLLYFFSREHFRGYVDFAAGGGDLRHTVDISTAIHMDNATDTVDSGPVFFGPGVGFHYDFSEHVGLVGELQGLVGVDNFTANIDANFGLAFNL